MKRPSYSNVMATAAMFIALGGTSYAAVKITGAEVRDGTLHRARRPQRLAERARRPRTDVSLRAADIARGQIPSGPRGPQGVAGQQGDKGDKGDKGPGGRWLLIDETGSIEQQSGGFTVISKPGIDGQPASNPNVYVDTGATLVGKGLSASTAIQNRLDRDGNGTADPAFAGDAAIGRCNTAAVACAPAGTNEDDTLVVRSLADDTDVTLPDATRLGAGHRLTPRCRESSRSSGRGGVQPTDRCGLDVDVGASRSPDRVESRQCADPASPCS